MIFGRSKYKYQFDFQTQGGGWFQEMFYDFKKGIEYGISNGYAIGGFYVFCKKNRKYAWGAIGYFKTTDNSEWPTIMRGKKIEGKEIEEFLNEEQDEIEMLWVDDMTEEDYDRLGVPECMRFKFIKDDKNMPSSE